MDARIVRAGTFAVIAVSMAVAVGAGGYVAGRGTADVDGAFDDGWAAGEASARQAVNSRWGEGGAGRREIARNAYARGRADGMRAGRRRGFAAGRRAGIRVGEQAIFAGFDGGWRVGSWYAVRIGHGEGKRGYSIPSRIVLDERRVRRLVAPVTPAGAPAARRR
jgi:hypothetical protein